MAMEKKMGTAATSINEVFDKHHRAAHWTTDSTTLMGPMNVAYSNVTTSNSYSGSALSTAVRS